MHFIVLGKMPLSIFTESKVDKNKNSKKVKTTHFDTVIFPVCLK
jgi:hypothetical protein